MSIVLGLMLKCCFTSTETVCLLGTGAQDGHLDFHTAPELCASVLFYVHRNRRLIRDGHLDFHTAPELWFWGSSVVSVVVE